MKSQKSALRLDITKEKLLRNTTSDTSRYYIWVKKFTDKYKLGLHDRRGHRKQNQKPRTAEEEALIRDCQSIAITLESSIENGAGLIKKVEELERMDAKATETIQECNEYTDIQ